MLEEVAEVRPGGQTLALSSADISWRLSCGPEPEGGGQGMGKEREF